MLKKKEKKYIIIILVRNVKPNETMVFAPQNSEYDLEIPQSQTADKPTVHNTCEKC